MANTSSNAFAINVIAAQSGVPTWRVNQAVNEWREIAGSSLSLAPTMPIPNGSNAPQGKQDAWIGWHIDTRTSKVYSVANGGHDDYHGNEVNVVDLTQNAPAWTQLVAPTASANVTVANAYYADGKPASRHSYNSQVFIESIDRALMFPGGSISTQGFPVTASIAAFSIQSGVYDSQTTWAGGGTLNVGIGTSTFVKHPTTEVVYGLLANLSIVRWNVGIPGSYTTLLSNPPTNPYYTAAAVDPTRGAGGRILFLGQGLGSAQSFVYDIAANSLTSVTLSDTSLATSGGLGLVYVPAIDRFIARKDGGGATVYSIHPSTWAVTTLSTTGNGASIPSGGGGSGGAPFTKFLYVPALGGVVFGPRWTANLWFLRLH